MPTTFRPYRPKQKLLLPPDLRDWLPEGHLAHHVSDLADSDYSNERDLAELEDRRIEGCVALGREGKTPTKRGGPETTPATWRMAKKLATETGRAIYGRRKWISEARHGWIKEGLGFRRFSVRGLGKVQGEWDLVCLAPKVKRVPIPDGGVTRKLFTGNGPQTDRRRALHPGQRRSERVFPSILWSLGRSSLVLTRRYFSGTIRRSEGQQPASFYRSSTAQAPRSLSENSALSDLHP